MMIAKTLLYLSVILFLSLISFSCFPSGQRFLTFQIESDGIVVYEGNQGVLDNTPVNEIWDILGDVRFESKAIQPSDSTEKSKYNRELEGAIVIQIKHIENKLDSVNLKKLILNSDDNGKSWCINSKETERIKVLISKKEKEK